MTDDAAEHWPYISEILYGLGVMADTYTLSVALLVDALADWIRFARLADAETVVNGEVSQVFAAKRAAWKQVVEILRDHGLTPATAKAIATKPDEKAGITKQFKLA